MQAGACISVNIKGNPCLFVRGTAPNPASWQCLIHCQSWAQHSVVDPGQGCHPSRWYCEGCLWCWHVKHYKIGHGQLAVQEEDGTWWHCIVRSLWASLPWQVHSETYGTILLAKALVSCLKNGTSDAFFAACKGRWALVSALWGVGDSSAARMSRLPAQILPAQESMF